MAYNSELKSLDEINYDIKSKFLYFFTIPLVILFFSFVSNFPITQKIESVLKSKMASTTCPIKFKNIHFEFFLPKVILSEIKIPPSCLQNSRQEIILSSLNIEWHLINFFPFGIPLKITTQLNNQPLSFYVVQGWDSTSIKFKDQKIDLKKLDNLIGKLKLSGHLTADINFKYTKQTISEVDLKVSSKNFAIPAQVLEDFKIPELKINTFYLEANSKETSKVFVEKFFLGTPDSPFRANFSGTIDLKKDYIRSSHILLNGETYFSSFIKEQIPLIEMFFQSFNQKDGFYQIKLGGTLGSPKLLPF